jgi:hypothetical protein
LANFDRGEDLVSIAFQLGSDPEFLIIDKTTKQPVSAIRLLPEHGKSNKVQISDDQQMFYDNVLLEFNVKPASTFTEFRENLGKCLSFAEKFLSTKNAKLAMQASTTFPKSECENPEASMFGCDPEYNIYKRSPEGLIMRVEPPVVTTTFRTCGGHIHIGHPIATTDRSRGGDPPLVVKLMDAFVGSTALLLDKDPTSQARRDLYGGAGTHRVASYGLEYRTLSNFWIRSPHLVKIMFQLTRQVIELAISKPDVIDNIIAPNELQDIINNGKVDDAQTFYDKISSNLSWELQELILQFSSSRPFNWEREWNIQTMKAEAVAG